jgi:dipeptidyl aminopeptidase/acylaminoacyl peptidase
VDREAEGIDPDEDLYLSLYGERTKKYGYARMRLGRAPEQLLFEDRLVSGLVRAKEADVFVYSKQRFDDSPDYFVAGNELGNGRQVSETNPFQSDFAWGHSELVDFESTTGRALQGALLYPPNYDAAKQYPMIVYTYEILSRNVHRYVAPSQRSYYNFSVFTNNGYLVLLPDIVYRGRDPGRSAVESVEGAVQSIVDRGIVDPDRVGLVGHSWGGYQATYIPTQTDIFAASVAGAPLTNFLSFMGAVHWRPGLPETGHWETGQARMGVPFWEDFEAHVRNSPAAFVHELNTPMLMMFGDDDGTVDWRQGVEFYNYARRAGKTDFVLLVYPGEDHGLRVKENQIDYQRRILQWFGHYLKGDPAPEWMTDGVSWLERKKMLEGN